MKNFMRERSHAVEQEEVMAFLDGELSLPDAMRVGEHIGDCTECRELAESFRRLSRELTAWEVRAAGPEMPADTLAALEAADKPEVKARRKSLWWRSILPRPRLPQFAAGTVFAALVLLLIVKYGVQEPKRHEETQKVSTAGLVRSQDSNKTESRESSRDELRYSPGGVIGGIVSDQATSLGQAYAPSENPATNPSARPPNLSSPMIARGAQLVMITNSFDTVRDQVEAIVKARGGYLANLSTNSAAGTQRTISASVRVPADQLDGTIADLKQLGRVQTESQSGEEVTAQYVDLQARLANSRNTEKRLTELLQNRTGKLSDVLEVEQEISRVRGDIESMDGELKMLAKRVSYAKVDLTITEEYKAPAVVTPPFSWRSFRNAAVEGYQDLESGVLGALLFAVYWVPNVVVWGGLLALAAWITLRILRRHNVES